MVHSYWIALVMLPPVLLFLLLMGYNKFVLGIEIKSERKQLQDYSAAEIAYAFFAAISIIGCFLGGLYLLDRFEPVNQGLCYLFLVLLSLPFTGAALAHYFEEFCGKGVGFQGRIFGLFLLPTLILLAATAYNGLADQNSAQVIRVKVVEKRIQINKGGGTPLLKLKSIDFKAMFLKEAREKEVNKDLYEQLSPGDEMLFYINPGALNIPWLGKVSAVKANRGGITATQPDLRQRKAPLPFFLRKKPLTAMVRAATRIDSILHG